MVGSACDGPDGHVHVHHARDLRELHALFGWWRLALFKINDVLEACVNHPTMRETRALRQLGRAVPAGALRLEEGHYVFTYRINGFPLSLALRARSSDVDVFIQIVRDGEYSDVTRMMRAGNKPLR